MGKDQRQHPVLVHRAQHITAQIAQLFLIDHLETAIDERLIVAGLLDRNFAVHQQIVLDQFIDERLGAETGFFEVAAEIERGLAAFARLVAVEQGGSAFEFADQIAGRVKAQRELFGIRGQLCQHERIAAGIRRNIDRRGQLAVFLKKGVHAFVQAHQTQRNRVFRNRKNDREMARGVDEFFCRQRNGVLADHPGGVLGDSAAPGGVITAVERHQVLVKQRQGAGLRRTGHGCLSESCWFQPTPGTPRLARTRAFRRLAALAQASAIYRG